MRWCISCCLILLLAGFTTSQAQVTLNPGKQDITGYRGRTTTFKVTVANRESEAVFIQPFMENLDISPMGNPFAADSSYDRGFAEWVTLDPPEFTVQPMESQVVTGKITIPVDAEGSYYCTFKITLGEQREEGGINTQGELVIASQAGVYVFVTVPSANNRAILNADTLLIFPRGAPRESDQAENVFETRNWEIQLPVSNSGNIHDVLTGEVSIWTASGVRIAQSPLRAGAGYVLPGRERYFFANGRNELPDGHYLMTLILNRQRGAAITDKMPFHVINGTVHMNDDSEEITELVRVTQQRFRFNNRLTQKKVVPRRKTIIPINIQNLSLDTLKLTPRMLDWSVSENGANVYSFDEINHERSANPWLTFSDTMVVLEPRQSKTFMANVQAEDDAIVGEYYSAIAFIPDDLNFDIVKNFLGARSHIIILTAADEGIKDMVINNLEVREVNIDGNPATRVLIEAENTGDSHCYISGKLSIEEEISFNVFKPLGSEGEFGSGSDIILPQTTRQFTIDLPEIQPGAYRLLLNLRYATEKPALVRVERFTIDGA